MDRRGKLARYLCTSELFSVLAALASAQIDGRVVGCSDAKGVTVASEPRSDPYRPPMAVRHIAGVFPFCATLLQPRERAVCS